MFTFGNEKKGLLFSGAVNANCYEHEFACVFLFLIEYQYHNYFIKSPEAGGYLLTEKHWYRTHSFASQFSHLRKYKLQVLLMWSEFFLLLFDLQVDHDNQRVLLFLPDGADNLEKIMERTGTVMTADYVRFVVAFLGKLLLSSCIA